MSAAGPIPPRRRFLRQSTALTVAFALLPAMQAVAQTAPAATLPGSLNTNRRLDAWLRVDAGGTVTVYSGKVELG